MMHQKRGNDEMYFANKEHKQNYEKLMNIYNLKHGQDVQYESSIYMAAYPRIFECFEESRISPYTGPLGLLLFDDEEEHNASSLTGSIRRMAELALSCFNGYEISLDEVFGSVVSQDMLAVIFQTMKIRARQ